ncbi:MAG: protein-L-isoaspartate(D-aspartate) O-methyltransferase [Gammaproteobacteria bacterium]|nr:protein-L-isoaspartate(D-aspartate) O-methyltransferase [Gammaproteobacteria bacterium]MCP5202079.1 protein-L-isoaspartate(D-aspartate) O-methyltransferase [Gammaproteobacteria bacterium]
MTDPRGIGLTSQRARNRLVDQLRGMGIRNEVVLEVMRTTPRHLFVDEALASRAYENTALPIGFGQTISQPYIVAAMTEALYASGSLERVLEVGAGCGYQSAVLAQLSGRVFSIERIAALANKLRSRLHELRINNVRVRHGDGFLGWPEHAPFDAILVAAAPVGIPEPLLQQLALGGRLIIPVGRAGSQELRLVTRTASGFEDTVLERVSFVPLLDGVS